MKTVKTALSATVAWKHVVSVDRCLVMTF